MAYVNGTQLASAMIGGLHDAGVLAGTVWMDPEFSGTAGKGETVNVRRLGVQTAADFSGTTVPVTEAEVTVPIVLSNQPYVQSLVTAKEKNLRIEDFYRQVVYPKVQGVAEFIEDALATTIESSTTPAVNDAAAKLAIIAAREALDNAKVPQTDRFLACSPAFISSVLGETWVQANTFGDGGRALQEAIVGRAFGFTIVSSTWITDSAGLGSEPSAYAYHKSAVMMASRTPTPPEGGADAATASDSGYGMRAVFGWDNSSLSDVVTVDTLFGTALSDDAGQRIVQPVYVGA